VGLIGLYGTETSFGKNVSTSSAGAVGPFQFEPATAKSLGVNPYDFKSAAFGAARYLAQYKSRGVGGMLSAYNAGPAGGYQSGYVNTTLNNAKSFGGAPNLPIPKISAEPSTVASKALPSTTPPTLNKEAFQKAQGLSGLGKLISSEKGSRENPLLASGLISPKAPLASEYMSTAKAPQARETARETPSATPPTPGGKLAGFLPANAELSMQRIDQGQDIRTNPGGPIIAPGDGEVIAVKSDPSGFGPDYPVVKFTSGPLAGTSWYLGHTHSTLQAGAQFKAGETLSHTGKGPGPVGNATVPGWAEIGLSSALGSGNMQAGQATKRYLK
jgi:hypothetical protein